jgi:hypothetical protein
VTGISTEGRRMLVLGFGGQRYAMHASELAAIDHDGAGARISVAGPVRDLGELLPGASAAAEPVRLIVQSGDRRHAFRAAATLSLVDTSSVYRLPRVLRDGCAPWIRGVVMLESPTVWIDLARLAAAT